MKSLEKLKELGKLELTEIESKELLKQIGVPIVETKLAKTREEAGKIAKNFGYPIVLKISSIDILHKSDAGGVKTFLKNSEEVEIAFDEIMKSCRKYEKNARVDGVVVQKHVKRGVEIIVGGLKDEIFGPTVMFGLGGIWIELMKDVSFRLAPVNKNIAKEMIKEIRGYPILGKFRGSTGVDINGIADVIVKISKFMAAIPRRSKPRNLLETWASPFFNKKKEERNKP